jgi:ribosome maturation factor RimP
MDSTALQKMLENLFFPVLEMRGIELVELVVSGGQRRKLIRIYVDRPNGITIGECAELSRLLADVLDTHDPIENMYVLEVSSPGLTRPLKNDRDFQRALGKLVKLVVDRQGTIIGILQTVTPSHLEVLVDGESVAIEHVRVQKANLHFDF